MVVTHTDGGNQSGNIHTHIVINSVRKYAVKRQSYMDKPNEEIAGYKHRSTKRFLEHLKKVMAMCEREGLRPAATTFQTQKDFLRDAIKECSRSAGSSRVFFWRIITSPSFHKEGDTGISILTVTGGLRKSPRDEYRKSPASDYAKIYCNHSSCGRYKAASFFPDHSASE